MRVIADHSRTAAFLISDGVQPSNEGRGYVLRRIMRRAMRHAELLGAREPLMWKLVPSLTQQMGQAFPELIRAQALITETLKLEETRFRRTLERGLAILETEVQKLEPKLFVNQNTFYSPTITQTPPASDSSELPDTAQTPPSDSKVLPGDVAFTLYDTYGFPLDLTQDALRARRIDVDLKGFNAAMQRQREKARASWAGSGDTKTADYWFPLREKFGATEFLGYETESSEGVVETIIRGGPEVKELRVGESGEIIFNQTPFYAEAGGQVGDTGWLIAGPEGKLVARVLAVHKEAEDLFVHNVRVENGIVKVGDAFRLEVDRERRTDIRRNHSATHLLHEALRQVLGEHVAQKGSLVAPDRLRFDFAHPKPVSTEEIARVEDIANDVVLQNSPVTTRLMAVDDAIASGARALFGEKYGDEVRVVAMGEAGNAMGWSVELCGGTHVQRTGDIGPISVIAEGAVGAGVRRIEALTGHAARKHANSMVQVAKSAAAELRVPLEEIPQRLAALMEDRKKLERRLSDANQKLALGGTGVSSQPDIKVVNGTKFLVIELKGHDPKNLKAIADQAKQKVESGVVAIANTAPEGTMTLVVGVTKDLTSRFDAVYLVRKGVEVLGGKGGGGKPDMAQGGGPDSSKADAALAAVEAALGG